MRPPRDGRLVAAKFLSYNGSYIVDPNTTQASETKIYDANGNSIINANPSGYLIVPNNYTIEATLELANQVGAQFSNTGSVGSTIAGTTAALGMMTLAFAPNGSHDLQRAYPGSTGVDPDCFVAGFTDAASFDLGLVASYSRIGEQAALTGGGLLNLAHKIFKSNIDISGADFNAVVNTNFIDAGAKDRVEIGCPAAVYVISLPPNSFLGIRGIWSN